MERIDIRRAAVARAWSARACRAAHLVAGAAVLALSSCSDEPTTRTIEHSQGVESASLDRFSHPASSGERFGFQAPSTAKSPELRWDTPAGWSEVAPTAMRAGNFRVAGDERAECYLTLLTGDAGGLAPNVDRWRGQMAQPRSTPEELAALERCPLLGHDAVLVDVSGTWSGMSGAQSEPNWRLVGLLLVDPNGSAFLKMTGPAELVGAQLDAFRALAHSFRMSDEDPHAAVAGGGANNSSNGLAWQAPATWRRAPERATRAVSFFVDEHDQVECYVTVLSGGAGGVLANVNRWRSQLSQSEMSAAEVEALPRIPMLGVEGTLVEFGGAGAAQDTLLVGALCDQSDASVFVKLSGPRDVVELERERFAAFCKSLARNP